MTYPYSRNHDNPGRLQELGVMVVDTSIAVDDRIISCKGPGTSLQVVFRLLEDKAQEAWLEPLLRSINAIASGMRNTG